MNLVARALGVKTEERGWRVGAKGEEKVAHEVAKLGSSWHVLQAVEVGDRGSDIGLGGAIGGVRWAASKLLSPPPLTVVDLGFLQDMIDHHEQALVIAHAYLANNPNGQAAPYASEVILYQERDLKRMDRFLRDGSQTRGAPDRMAMTWMGAMEHAGMVMPAEGMPVSQMPGMQPLSRIQELEKLQGKDADRLFFQLMTDHHKGGIEMAASASTTASRKAIRDFAAYVVNGQKIEIVEYSQAVPASDYEDESTRGVFLSPPCAYRLTRWILRAMLRWSA